LSAHSADRAVPIPRRLAETCRANPELDAWLARLPSAVESVRRRWSLSLGEPFAGDEGSCAWVAPVTRADGTAAVLKLGMPHMEGAHEIDGLRFWDGDPTVRLHQADEHLNAMLLERCEPGTALRSRPEPEQDVVIARLLRRLWRTPPVPHPFRSLAEMTAQWSESALAETRGRPDEALVREGVRLLDELSRSSPVEVLLATDLHAGNVLSARREPWLVIDPKPLAGEREFSVAPIVRSSELGHSKREALYRLDRLCSELELDRDRALGWTIAQTMAWSDGDETSLDTVRWLLEDA
jgi:streptomycin 6-kinase